MELFTAYTRLAFGATMIVAVVSVLLEQIGGRIADLTVNSPRIEVARQQTPRSEHCGISQPRARATLLALAADPDGADALEDPSANCSQ